MSYDDDDDDEVGVLPKRLNIGSMKQCCTILQGFLFSVVKDLEIQTGSPQRGRPTQVEYVKVGDFLNQYLDISKKRCKIGTLLL